MYDNRPMKSDSRRFIIALVFIAILSSVAAAQEPPLQSISYQLSMSRPMSHLFEVQIIVELPEELKDKPLQFQMAKWSPGRYGVFDFAKNVQEFRANAPGDTRQRSNVERGAAREDHASTFPTKSLATISPALFHNSTTVTPITTAVRSSCTSWAINPIQ